MKYLIEERGLNPETIERFKLTADTNGNIKIPIIINEEVKGYKTRLINGLEKKYLNDKGLGNQIFNIDTLKDIDKDSTVVITEGEFDSISFEQYGIKAISNTTGVNRDINEILNQIPKIEKVVIGFDNDKYGRKKMFEIAREIEGSESEVMFFCINNYKDINELVVKNKKYGDEIVKKLIEYKLKHLSLKPREFIQYYWDEFGEEESFSVIRLADVKEELVKYLVDPFIVKGSINLITGAPASLKSMISLYMIKCLQNGELFLEEFDTEKIGKVLFIDQENILSENRKRYLSFGGNPESIDFLNERIYFDKTQDVVKKLKNLIYAKGYEVIVIDTFRSTSEKMDENSSKDVNAVFGKFAELTPQSTIVLLHHETKPSPNNGNTYYRGSGDIQAKVSSHLSIKKDSSNSKEAYLTIKHSKSRYSAPSDDLQVRFYTEEDNFHFELLSVNPNRGFSISQEDKERLLLEFIDESGSQGRHTKEIQLFCKDKLDMSENPSRELRSELESARKLKVIRRSNSRKNFYILHPEYINQIGLLDESDEIE